jgi:hypothetical protein
VDRAPIRVVVERDVAGDDGNAERLAGSGHAFDRLGQLPRDLGLLRVAEVEAVGDRERLAAGAGHVARRFEDGRRAAGVRVEAGHAAGTVEADREAAIRGAQSKDGRVEPWPADRPRADEVVVAAEDPGPAAEVRRGEELEEGVARRRSGGSVGRLGGRARLPRHFVARSLVGQERDRNRAREDSLVVGAQLAGLRHLPDRRVVELPAVADLLDCGQVLGTDDRDHPLLALGDHDLPGLHLLLAERNVVELDVDAAAARHLGERGREPRGAAVLERDDEVAVDELEARFDQLLAGEGVADLHRRPLVRVFLA